MTHKEFLEEWKEKLEKVLPLIVADYNEFITETGGEIGELDLEEIVQERVEPVLTRAMLAAARGAAAATIPERIADIPTVGGYNEAIYQSEKQFNDYFKE